MAEHTPQARQGQTEPPVRDWLNVTGEPLPKLIDPTTCDHCYDLIGCSVINIYQCRDCGDWDYT